jgi:hypothetical protein
MGFGSYAEIIFVTGAHMKKRLTCSLALLVSVITIGGWSLIPGSAEATKIPEATSASYIEAGTSIPRRQTNQRLHTARPIPNAMLRPDSGSLSLNIARRGQTSTVLKDGRVVIIGGQNEYGPVSETEVIDTRERSIKMSTSLSVARARHTATRLPDGRILVAGGWDQKDSLDSTEIFDPVKNSFSRGPQMNHPRAAHNATALEDGRVLITGGRSDSSAEIFDPRSQTFTLLRAKTVAPRNFHGAALLNDGNILLVGGVDENGELLDSAEIFNTATFSFSPALSSTQIRRVSPSLRVLPDGKVQVLGGDYDGTMEIYDPIKNVFSAPAHLVPTADIFPVADILHAQTRGAFIDAKIPARDKSGNEKQARAYTSSSRNALKSHAELLSRVDYSYVEIGQSNQAVVAGGLDGRGQYLRSVFLLNSSPASVTTSQIDYLRGERPIIYGSGWQPGERISIVRQEARPTHKRTILKAHADDQGNFVNTDIPVTDYREGVTYTLTVMGETSRNIAQTVYSYAPPADPALRKKPRSFKFSAPIFFRDASFEHEEGIMIIRPISGLSPKVKPPELLFSTNDLGLSHTFTFDAITDKRCFGLLEACDPPVFCPCGPDLDVRLKSGSFLTVSAGVSGDASVLYFDDTDIPKGVSVSASVREEVTGNIIFSVDAKGSHTKTIPFPVGVVFSVTVGPLTGTLSLGNAVKIEVNLNDPGTRFTTNLAFNESVEVGFSASAQLDDPPFTFTPFGTVNGNFTPGFDLQRSRGGFIKLSLGPQATISLTASFLGCTVGPEVNLGIFDFVRIDFITSNTPDCERFSFPVSVGVDANVTGKIVNCIDDIELLDQPFNILSLPIGEFDPVLATDTLPPTFTPKLDVITGTAPGACSRLLNYTLPAASDSCSGLNSVTCNPSSGSVFQKGVTTVTCIATDRFNNSASTAFNVIVNDNERPVINCPANIVKSTDSNQCSSLISFNPAVSDNCSGVVAPLCTPPSGIAFPKGSTKVTCTVRDAANNLSLACSFMVTVNDTQPPAIACPQSITVPAATGLCSATVSYAPPSVSDNCPGVAAPVCTPLSGSTFPKGTTSVTCTVSDAVNNQSACSFTITVVDTQAPTIICPPNIITNTINAGDATVAVNFAAPVIADNCPGLSVVCVPPSSSQFPRGVTTVICTVTDAANNQGSCTFTVRVFDYVIADEANGKLLRFDSVTGEYDYFDCRKNITLSGRGVATISFCKTELRDTGPDPIHPDRNLFAEGNPCMRQGTATLSYTGVTHTIKDFNLSNNLVRCPDTQ